MLSTIPPADPETSDPTIPNWDTLRALGLPLAGPVSERAERTPEALVRELRRGLEAFHAGEAARAPGAQRRREALAALVLALRVHFPSVHARLRRALPSEAIATLGTTDPSGRVVKLARVATRALAEYL